jgi:hypothetical protein
VRGRCSTRIRRWLVMTSRVRAAGADPNAFSINGDGWLQVALYGAAGVAGDPDVTRMTQAPARILSTTILVGR